MKNSFGNTTKNLVTGTTLLAPLVSHAQSSAIINAFCTAADWAFTFAMVAGIFAALYAAFLYMASEGDADKTGTARRTLLYAAVGIAIAILAGALPTIVSDFLGVAGVSNPCPA